MNHAYAALLYPLTVERLDHLKAVNGTGVALQAAWAEVKASVPAIPASIHHSRRSRSARLPAIAVARFLGFVEGRLGMTIPGWWQDSLADAGGGLALETGLLHLHIRPKHGPYYLERYVCDERCRLHGSDEGCSVHTRGDVAGVQLSKQTLSLFIGQYGIDLPRTEDMRCGCYVSARVVEATQCVLVVHGVFPTAKLLSVDLLESKVKWETEVWCDLAPYIRSGGGFFHWAEVCVSEGSVFVFGACNDVLYIEGFGLDNGCAKFRFSTTYGWTIDGEKSGSR